MTYDLYEQYRKWYLLKHTGAKEIRINEKLVKEFKESQKKNE